MNIEEFIRAHVETGKKDFIFHVEVDPNTKKIVARFDDDQPDGGVANVRIEGNQIILQSHDTAEEKRIAREAAEKEAAEKKRIAEEAQAEADKAQDIADAAKAAE